MASSKPKPSALGVAPRTGAWIEIACECVDQLQRTVAPHTGAWIEIDLFLDVSVPR